MKEFNTLFVMRESLNAIEKSMGLANFNETEKAIVEYLFAKIDKDNSLKDLLRDEYFKEKSEATVKRALGKLIKAKIVFQEFAEDDKRNRLF